MSADAIEAMERAWAAGARASDAAPAAWREAAGSDELAMLALAAQAARLTLRPALEPDDPPRAPLPRLALPTLPEALRPRLRDALAAPATASHAGLVLDLLAARGVSAHPLDWMPGAGADDPPALYEPWVAWVGGAAAAHALTEETWDDLTPAPRRAKLGALRRRDPAAARALMEAKLAARPAEERADLVGLLGQGLCEADAPFLSVLTSDRSGRVREEAGRLLTLLDSGADGETDAEAVRAAVEAVRRGLFRARLGFRPTSRARGRGGHRFGAVSGATLAGVARALDTDPISFVRGWEWGQHETSFDAQVAGLVARTGDEAAVLAAVEVALASPETGRGAAGPLASRIDAATWERWLAFRLGCPPDQAGHGLVGPGDLGRVSSEVRVLGAADGVGRSALLAAIVAGEPERQPHDRRPGQALAFLGLIASPDAARAALDAMMGAGRTLADPDLAVLRLSAALPDGAQP